MDRVELAAFLDTGVAMLGAAADEHVRPEAFRVWGASIDEKGRLRVLASAEAGIALDVARRGGRMAFTFTDITTFRSVQVKGPVVVPVEPPGPAEVELMRHYAERFSTRVVEVGHSARLGAAMAPIAVFVVSVEIEDLYDQTPGPGAGSRLQAG